MSSPSASIASSTHQGSEDALLASRILGHDPKAFVELMRQHNGALFRTARSIVRDDADAEDVLQESYVLAYRHLHTFRGDARLSTWLTRIVINQASGRLRAERRHATVVVPDDARRGEATQPDGTIDEERPESPEDAAVRGQMRRLLERKIDELPATFRTAFVLREVEELTIDEVADCLSIPSATVRTRVFRARALLRASIAGAMDVAVADVFRFDGARCDRIVARVMARVSA